VREAPGGSVPGASGLQELDLPFILGGIEPAQLRAEPGDGR